MLEYHKPAFVLNSQVIDLPLLILYIERVINLVRGSLAVIEALDKSILSLADVAGYLECDIKGLCEQALLEPEKLGFPVIVIGTLVMIPKDGFVFYCRYGQPSVQSNTNSASAGQPDIGKLKPKYYECSEVAEIFKVPIHRVWAWIRRKQLKAIRLNGGKKSAYRVRQEDLEAFEKAHMVP